MTDPPIRLTHLIDNIVLTTDYITRFFKGPLCAKPYYGCYFESEDKRPIAKSERVLAQISRSREDEYSTRIVDR